jgi:hypothetical protein
VVLVTLLPVEPLVLVLALPPAPGPALVVDPPPELVPEVTPDVVPAPAFVLPPEPGRLESALVEHAAAPSAPDISAQKRAGRVPRLRTKLLA